VVTKTPFPTFVTILFINATNESQRQPLELRHVGELPKMLKKVETNVTDCIILNNVKYSTRAITIANDPNRLQSL